MACIESRLDVHDVCEDGLGVSRCQGVCEVHALLSEFLLELTIGDARLDDSHSVKLVDA